MTNDYIKKYGCDLCAEYKRCLGDCKYTDELKSYDKYKDYEKATKPKFSSVESALLRGVDVNSHKWKESRQKK